MDPGTFFTELKRRTVYGVLALIIKPHQRPNSPRRVSDRTGSASRTGANRGFAAFILCLIFVASMNAQQAPAERVAEITAA